MPVHLGAIAAGIAVKKAYPALSSAVRLTRSVRVADAAQAGPQLHELAVATAELRAAVRGQGLKGRRKRADWEAMQRRALQPTVEFALARRVVGMLQERGPLAEAVLAAELGTVAENETFRQALAMAEHDRRLEPLAPATWVAVTPASLIGDESLLRELGYVDELSGCVVAITMTEGLVRRQHLLELARQEHGEHRFRVAAFDAALEQALADGEVAWLGPDLFGIPIEELRDRRFGDGPGTGPTGDVGAAIRRVVAASQSVREAVSGSGAPDIMPLGARPADPFADVPYPAAVRPFNSSDAAAA